MSWSSDSKSDKSSLSNGEWQWWLMQFSIHSRHRLHLTMDNYHRKFGPIFQVKLGETSMIFVSSGEYIRTMFQPQTEGKYPKHQLPPAWIYFNQKHQVKRGLLFMWVHKIDWFELERKKSQLVALNYIDSVVILFHSQGTMRNGWNIDNLWTIIYWETRNGAKNWTSRHARTLSTKSKG